jgi:ABC-type oligopeptide transport system ATPase subunit
MSKPGERETLYRIPKFTSNLLYKPFGDKIIAVVGKRGSGKTTCIKGILTKMPKYSMGVAFAPTDQMNGTWSSIFPASHVYNEPFDIKFFEEKVKDIEDYQMEERRRIRAKIESRQEKPLKEEVLNREVKKYLPPIVVVLDDIFYEKKMKNNPALTRLILNGRHSNIVLIFALQYLFQISAELRPNLDFVFFCAEKNPNAQEKLWKEYFKGVIPKLRDFTRVFTRNTENHTYLVFLPNANTNKAEEALAYFRNPPVANPKVGSNSLRAWTRRHYVDKIKVPDDVLEKLRKTRGSAKDKNTMVC